jgi:hypothetical protein
VLFIHLVVGTKVITAEQKLKDNKEFTVLQNWDTDYICDYLKKAVNGTYLAEYQKAYVDTKVDNCMLAPLFQKQFNLSKNLDIVKD